VSTVALPALGSALPITNRFSSLKSFASAV
jgi:hypothetical protein